MFGQENIQWVRNVKRDGGTNLAYYGDEKENEFVLHWSKQYKSQCEALKPRTGDIILLFQRFGNKRPHLTHLVTPINSDWVDCQDNNPDFPWGREVAVIARAPGGNNPKPNELNFRSVSRTHSYHIESIGSPFSKEELQATIWSHFQDYLNPLFDSKYENFISTEKSDDFNASEGAERFKKRIHRYRERSSELVKVKKEKSIDKACECCSFDFEKTYGSVGSTFIECHHRLPIHSGERITKLEDLALVCSNCHRMLHRKNYKSEYYSVEELRDIILKRTN